MKGVPIPCRDHLGREYPTRAAMARAWGLQPATVRMRLARGENLSDALTAGLSPADRRAVPTTLDGVLYPSRAAAAASVGLTVQGLAWRLGRADPPKGPPKNHGGHGRWVRISALLDLWRIRTGRWGRQEAAE